MYRFIKIFLNDRRDVVCITRDTVVRRYYANAYDIQRIDDLFYRHDGKVAVDFIDHTVTACMHKEK